MKNKKLLIIVSLLFILNSIFVILGITSSFDNAIYNFVSNKLSFLNDYFLFITKFGNEEIVICIVILFLLVFKDIKFLILPFIGFIINSSLKVFINRDRPSVRHLVEESSFSYPSGHSMISLVLYGYLIYYIYKHINNKIIRNILIGLLILIIISIGISRVYVGVHYISDVLGGYLLGLIVLIGGVSYVKNGSK